MSLQGGDVETQKQILAKEKELFQKDKDIQELKIKLQSEKEKNSKDSSVDEFVAILSSGSVDDFITAKKELLGNAFLETKEIPQHSEAIAFGLVDFNPKNSSYMMLTEKGKAFFKWLILGDGK